MGTARGDYEGWHRQRAEAEAGKAAEAKPWHQLVEEHLDLPEDALVLELACGRGELAARLAERGLRVVAADFSREALKAGIARGIKRPVTADALRLPFAEGTFDAVVSCETIEHLPDWRAGLAEMVRVLRPGGTFYLTFPSYLNAYGLYRAYLRLRGRPFNSGDEVQPVEQLLFSGAVRRHLRGLGLKLTAGDAVGHYLLLPGVNPVRTRQFWIEKCRFLRRLLRPFALHQFLLAGKDSQQGSTSLTPTSKRR